MQSAHLHDLWQAAEAAAAASCMRLSAHAIAPTHCIRVHFVLAFTSNSAARHKSCSVYAQRAGLMITASSVARAVLIAHGSAILASSTF